MAIYLFCFKRILNFGSVLIISSFYWSTATSSPVKKKNQKKIKIEVAGISLKHTLTTSLSFQFNTILPLKSSTNWIGSRRLRTFLLCCRHTATDSALRHSFCGSFFLLYFNCILDFVLFLFLFLTFSLFARLLLRFNYLSVYW